MITVYLKGGLGNIFFQYAVGRAVAIRNNTSLCLDLSHYISIRDISVRNLVRELGYLQLNAELFVPSVLSKAKSCLGIGKHADNTLFKEKQFGYDAAVLVLGDESRLDGYFQSEKYFKRVEQQIREDLQFRRPFVDRKVSVYQNRINDSNSVAIHIRRGDYLKKPLHNICTERYYFKSIEYMRESLAAPSFFVFSDDIEWCRANMKSGEYDFVDINIAAQRLIEFHLMCSCKHAIISNSSFSWWAAWLNSNSDKIIVSPNRWFNDEIMNAQALRHTIPDNWIRINF